MLNKTILKTCFYAIILLSTQINGKAQRTESKSSGAITDTDSDATDIAGDVPSIGDLPSLGGDVPSIGDLPSLGGDSEPIGDLPSLGGDSEPITNTPPTKSEPVPAEVNSIFLQNENEKEISSLTSKAKQPQFFTLTGITPAEIKDRLPSSGDEFVEVTSATPLVKQLKTDPAGTERTFTMKAIYAGEFVFVTFVDESAKSFERKEYKFFFLRRDALNETFYFREVSEECPFPKGKQVLPVTVTKCKWFYKKVESQYDFSLKLNGEKATAEIMGCVVKGVFTLKNQPTVELLCMEESANNGLLKVVTKEQYDELIKTHTRTENDNVFLKNVDEKVVNTIAAA